MPTDWEPWPGKRKASVVIKIDYISKFNEGRELTICMVSSEMVMTWPMRRRM